MAEEVSEAQATEAQAQESEEAKEPEEPQEPEEPDDEPSEDEDKQEAPKLEAGWQQLQGTPRIHPRPKFLAWNEYGHVASYPELLRLEIQRNGEEKSQVIKDFDNLQLAAISEGVVCLASTSSSPTGARVLLRPTQRWEKAVFSAPLGCSNESPEAIAAGEDFVAVLTSSCLLRMYTFSGLPIGLLSLPGKSVALAARGALLLAVTRVPGGEEDELEFRLLDTKSRSERAAGHVPLSEGAFLRWVGFSEDMVPLALDTLGVARALLGAGTGSWGSCHVGAEWTPVLSLDSEEGDLWVVHATSNSLEVVEVETEPFPPHAQEIAGEFLPAPAEFGVGGSRTLRSIPWHLPVGAFPCGGEAIESTFREQLLLRHQQDLVASNLQENGKVETCEKKYKTGTLKLFTQLAKSGEVERAHQVAKFYLAKVSGGEKVLEMAGKLAESAKQYKLADEIATLRSKRIEALDAQARAPHVPSATLFRAGEFEGEQNTSGLTPTLAKTEPPSPPKATTAMTVATTVDKTKAPVASLPSKLDVDPKPMLREASPEAVGASPVKSANPFARKRPNQVANGTRQPATPMGSPASKMRRT